ncbi:group II intron reverse transcriptase/maturase [Nocardia australiensis]|uniref:group II intron reverse transcriptase/maturase n=1 Tax=Nocardia australiensis TaxID=2887191 RepID=UPI001D1345B3|nr:group II intron reverse transcriptase/maturase [Nocardia australiensis]
MFRHESALTWAGWAFDESDTEAAELKDKLDTTPQQATTAIAVAAVDEGVVNGPEGFDWDAVRWRRTENEVRRLRQRIFKASLAGDLKQVRNLQKLMLRSRANTLVSVRQVAERNTGRKTAGIDGRLALTAESRAKLVLDLQHHAKPWQALPVRRVYIPKKGGKLRPLGIPVLIDRAQRARVRNALEPEWEARFEPRSYGFRPGRSCHDAIVAIQLTLQGAGCQRVWVLDADLAAAFDRIDHDHLLDQIGQFPAREQVREWLKAGVMDKGRYSPTEEGTPQGGVISPLLLNVALHGMETAVGVRYRNSDTGNAGGRHASPVMVRYADDFVAMCHSREQADQIRQRLEQWLAPRGLAFNEAKTRIVHASEGFDFLGYNVRRYHTQRGGKLLIKPSRESIKKMQQRLTAEMRSLRGAGPADIARRLNPIIRGWAAYHRPVVASEAFAKLDNHLWPLTYRWAIRRHPLESRSWVASRYFGRFNTSRQDRWVFGDRVSGAYVHRFAWTKIVRHALVTGWASPDDPALTEYWSDRRRKRQPPPLAPSTMLRIKAQHGRCPLCGEYLLFADHEPQSPSQWEQWFTTIGAAVKRHLIVAGPVDQPNEYYRLVHAHCQRRQPANASMDTDSISNASTPQRPARAGCEEISHGRF